MLESGLGIIIHRRVLRDNPFHLLHRWERREKIRNPEGERSKKLDGGGGGGERRRERKMGNEEGRQVGKKN